MSAPSNVSTTTTASADAHLEAGRLCHAQGKMEDAAEHFQAAKKLIEETGYFRRKKELRDNY